MSLRSIRSLAETLLRRGRSPDSTDRSRGLEEELRFWRNWLKSGGLEWPQDFQDRFDPSRPLPTHLAGYVDRVGKDHVDILDVGAGPLTKLGGTHPACELTITPTDLLAEEYDRLLDELGIVPPIRTLYADAQALGERFGQNRFDVVHGQNCIDHTADPFRAIEEMMGVCKPGGFVVLYHVENEGRSHRYTRLHQWDFRCEDGQFVIGGRDGRETNVTEWLAGRGEVECTRVEDGPDIAILTAIRKATLDRLESPPGA
jgi:SAM-dependent methyltransferase